MLDRVLPRAHMVFIEDDSINRDPTNWWVQSRECVEGMMRSCGFCDVGTVDYAWSRGIFYGFSPKFGNDVEELLSLFNENVVMGSSGHGGSQHH